MRRHRGDNRRADRPERHERPTHSERPNRVDRPNRPERPDGLVVEGMAALSEYARFRPRSLGTVYCRPDCEARVRELLSPLGLRPQVVPRGAEGDMRVPPEAPVWADVSLTPLGEKDLMARVASRAKDLIVALDHITDPRNLGAVVRSAAFFGVRDVVVPERRQVLLTRASVATAQGGFALVDLSVVVNLGRALEELKERGYWIIGADMDGEAISSLVGVYDKVVLVLGAEDKGMSREVRKKCDRVVSIAGIRDTIESLNVSVAGGILLHAFCAK